MARLVPESLISGRSEGPTKEAARESDRRSRRGLLRCFIFLELEGDLCAVVGLLDDTAVRGVPVSEVGVDSADSDLDIDPDSLVLTRRNGYLLEVDRLGLDLHLLVAERRF